MQQRTTFIIALIVSIACLLPSCHNEDGGITYTLKEKAGTINQPLLIWHIESEMPQYDRIYHPLYNQLDLKEVYAEDMTDSASFHEGQITHLSCTIKSRYAQRLYLDIRTVMPIVLLLNGDTLQRTDIQGLNFYPIDLQAGQNELTADVTRNGEDWSFEATILDSMSMAQAYAEGQSCNIIYPLIPSDTKDILLTNAHQNVLSQPVSLKFSDTDGNLVAEVALEKDSFVYHVGELEKDISYICSMKVGNTVVRQPVLCGKDDDALAKFTSLRKTLPDGHPRADEADQVLYRLRFLLNHPSRYEGDWWWQFKISPLTYQLEHIFTHLDETYGTKSSEFNVKFLSYRSALDDTIQRYLLITPDSIHKDQPAPLVVIIRPFCENYHHFFASPQLARQWAINIVQGLANHYGFIVMMPEGRMPMDEDLTPKAEREIRQAIADVRKHFRIDESRIYLQANCTGGYRALKFAESNPKLFAAIALYAPVYQVNYSSAWSQQHTAKSQIALLKNIPLMIHYDPLDKHSTPAQFEKLIEDCQHYGIPLSLSVKRNSGQFYNVVIAGYEAFDFFEGKQKQNNY